MAEEKNQPILEYAILFLAIVASLVIFMHLKNQEANLCRSIFSGLASARYRVEKYIDWEGLKALGADVGASYKNLPNEEARTNYKKAFIRSFSNGFKRSGSRLGFFAHGRVYSKDNEKTVIAYDYLRYNKTLLFTLSKSGKRKLISIDWEDK